jgi:translation elongation factor EF-Ts
VLLLLCHTLQIVEGRLDKIKKQYALLEQPALRDNNKTVGELIKETIAATGENIQVGRIGASSRANPHTHPLHAYVAIFLQSGTQLNSQHMRYSGWEQMSPLAELPPLHCSGSLALVVCALVSPSHDMYAMSWG